MKPHGFASYEFTLPSGSVNVAVTGEFTATGNSSSDIEVYVFKDDAFVSWQGGYSPSAYYSSSRIIKGDVNAELPAGAGTYYVVFNNNFSPRTTKSVQSEVTLHYTKFLAVILTASEFASARAQLCSRRSLIRNPRFRPARTKASPGTASSSGIDPTGVSPFASIAATMARCHPVVRCIAVKPVAAS